ncbi:hypothetical protein FB446DRAFT_782599 [Lentinula raphanica]|nr:hypothetical protein FB446DRAFT_782599 [Lentinula raphanica]
MSRYQNTCLTVTATIEGENEAGKERTGTALINTPEGVVAATVTSLGDDPAGLGVLVEANVSAETIVIIEGTSEETETQDGVTTRERGSAHGKETVNATGIEKQIGEEMGRNLLDEKYLLPKIRLVPVYSPTSKPDSEYSNNAEAGQVPEDDDTAMMAMMGMAGFGSTKGKHVEGNQEGAVNIKKTRTWRQYMNRLAHNHIIPMSSTNIQCVIDEEDSTGPFLAFIIHTTLISLPIRPLDKIK